MKRLFFAFILSLACAHIALADLYVREGASGTTCADWGSNACASAATAEALIARGQTIWVADGNYGIVTFDVMNSGTTRITVKKATISAHGTSTGWLDTYGDGVGVWTKTTFLSDYWTFDGVTGGGPGSWTSGHGFQFVHASDNTDGVFVDLFGDPRDHITFRHTYFHETGTVTGIDHGYTAFQSGNVGSGNLTNFISEYNYFDNLGGLPYAFRSGTGNLFQYNYSGLMCGVASGPATNHCEMFVFWAMNDSDFRYNYALTCTGGGCSGTIEHNDSDGHILPENTDGMRFYGNVFVGGKPINCTGTMTVATNWVTVQNTFINIAGAGFPNTECALSGITYNNIVLTNSQAYALSGTHNYNILQAPSVSCDMKLASFESAYHFYPTFCDSAVANFTSSIFANFSGVTPEDFRLNQHLVSSLQYNATKSSAGYDICTLLTCDSTHPYNVDMLGHTFGVDGTWDRGAFQYIAPQNQYYFSLSTNTPPGNDSNPGSIGAPFLTPQHCVNVLIAGDTCNGRAGTYNLRPSGPENDLNIGPGYTNSGTSWTNPITLKAYNGETVVLQQNGYDIIANLHGTAAAMYWIFDGLIFDGSTGPAFRACNASIGGLIAGGANYFRIQNSEIKNGKSQGALLTSDDSFEITNTNVHDNGTLAFVNCDGISIQLHGLYWYGKHLTVDGGNWYSNAGFAFHIFSSGACSPPIPCDGYNTVRNTRIYSNNPYPGGNGGGLLMSVGPSNIAYNNVIYNNIGTGIDIDFRATANAAYNNTVYGNTGGISVGPSGQGDVYDTVLQNNIVYSNGTGITDQGNATTATNNFTANPDFTNAGSSDFTLLITSGARAFALNKTALGIAELDNDIAGNARGAVGNWDAGAYKYVTTCTTPDHLDFTSQPSSALVGATLGTVSVSIKDSGGNVCTGATTSITLSKESGATWNAIVSGSNLTKSAVSGVATWTDLDVTPTPGVGSLHAAASGLTAATSSSFTVTASGTQASPLISPLMLSPVFNSPLMRSGVR